MDLKIGSTKYKEENHLSQINTTQAALINATESRWKSIYKIAAVAVSISVLLMLLDIISTFVFKEKIAFGTFSAIDWFAIFHNSWFSGLRNLGLFNVIEMILSIPLLFALYATHLDTNKPLIGLAVILSFVGMAIYISNNAAIPMYVLGGKYGAATTDAQRSILAAAGQGIIARGEDFTPGAFTGFILGEIANIIIAFVMLRGGVFGKKTAYIGILGIGLLTVYTIMVTFVPAMQNIAMIVAMIGGPLGTVWYILIARRLFQIGKITNIVTQKDGLKI